MADAEWFVGSPWAGQAAALGWSTLDVFGCHRLRPADRLDAQGLVWLLNGTEIVALTAEGATVRTSTGAAQSIRRRPLPQAVPAWDLAAVERSKPPARADGD